MPIAPRSRRGGYRDVAADDPPEVLHDGAVDLGAVATEFLLLGIDPYPRKPGAVFDAPAGRRSGRRIRSRRWLR